MAIALDSSVLGVDASKSWSHTCTGIDLLLIVTIYCPDGGSITGVTYNGVSMTSIGDIAGTRTYYLLNPSTGANTVSVTGGSTHLRGASISYTGVDQTGFPDSTATSNGGGLNTPVTLDTTVVASNCWLVLVGGSTAVASPTLSTDRTNRQNGVALNSTFTPGSVYIGDSNGIVNTGIQGATFTPGGSSYPSVGGIRVISIAPPPPITAPTVTTQAVTAIQKTTATGNGNVTADGGATITERGIVVSTSLNPTTADSKFTSAGTTGAFTASITGLTKGTAYHARAYAINSVGTSYGSDVTFTTKNDYPIIIGQGSFSLTGENLILHYGRKIIASLGSFLLTGQSILFKLGNGITAGLGSFTLTGQNILFKIVVSIKAGLGSFVLTGKNVLFHIALKIKALLGSFTLTGQDLILSYGRSMQAIYGAFTLTGKSILLKIQRLMTVVYGSFILSGKVVRFAVNGLYVKWKNTVKNVATWINKIKNL